jgi:hypothetical protein
MNANGRLCRKFKVRFGGIAKLGRPIYRATSGTSVADAIARERAVAKRQAAIKRKPK